jgi:hypothetical protein
MAGTADRAFYKGNETPGPGAYEYGDERRSVKGITIGPKLTESLGNETPPPWHYNVRRDPQTDGKGGVIREKPKESARKSTKGADYVPPPFGSDAARIAISPRRSRTDKNDIPPPGTYDPVKPFGSGLSPISLSKGFSTPRSGDSGPGPGAYSPESNWGKGRGVRISGGRREPKPEETPGYVKLRSTLGGPKFSLSSRPPLEITYH